MRRYRRNPDTFTLVLLGLGAAAGLYFFTRKSSATPAASDNGPVPATLPQVPSDLPPGGVQAFLTPAPGTTLSVSKGSRVTTKPGYTYTLSNGWAWAMTSDPQVLTPVPGAPGDFFAANAGTAVLYASITAGDGKLYLGKITVIVTS